MNFSLLFKPHMTFRVGPNPKSVALGDLNQDTFLDIVTSNYDDGTVSILFGYGNGSFAPQKSLTVGSDPRAIALGHLNSDTFLDIVNSNYNDGTVSVLLNHGNGSFATQQTFTVGPGPWAIALGDLNNDTFLDIVSSNQVSDNSTVSILLGYGNGSFAPRQTFTAGSSPTGIALGDLNQDTFLDIITTSRLSNGTISVLMGYGNGSFAPQQLFAVEPGPAGVAVGDLNHDTFLDAVTSSYGSNTISALIGQGNGSFAPQQAFTVGSGPLISALGDLNQDTFLDIVSCNSDNSNVSVLIGYGNGSFAPQQAFMVGLNPSGVVLGHLNHDTLLDIVSCNGDSTISVLLGNPDVYTLSTTLSTTHTVTSTSMAIARSSETSTHTTNFLHTFSPSVTPTQTLLPYSVLIPSNHTYYPKGPVSVINQFNPTEDKIDLTVYPGITYLDLSIQQMGDSTVIRFIYQATFLCFINNTSGRTITKDNFVCSSSTQRHRWAIQTYPLITPTNNTYINNFNPNQDKIDLTHYNISCQNIQIQIVSNNVVTQFNYPEQVQITVNQTKASDLGEKNFILPLPAPSSETPLDRIIGWVKILVGPVASALSTAVGIYLKRGLLQNILYASDFWKGDRYIKETIWAPEDEAERHALMNRHNEPILMKEVDGIKLFTVFNEDTSSCLMRILPNYYIQRRQSEFMNPKSVTIYPVSGKAWIKLNSGILNEEETDAFFIQVIAKSGEILEQFECSLENLKTELRVFNLDMSAAPEEEVSITGSQIKTLDPSDYSNTGFSSLNFNYVRVQWDNPVLQDTRWLHIAYQSSGIEGINRLIEIGTDPARYRQFVYLEASLGIQKAVETLLLSDGKCAKTYMPIPTLRHEVGSLETVVFWAGMIAYRLPAAYDQTHYLLKIAGFDLQTFYAAQGVDEWANDIGPVLRPSLLLGGATVGYCTSSDPLVLLVAINQPGFGMNHNHPLSDWVYYLTGILSLARTCGYSSGYALPLMTLQGTHLLSRALVDAGYMAEDNDWLQFMQSATGLVTEALGFILYPDLPVKILQGISLFAQGAHCAELAWGRISSYLPYAEVDGTIDSNPIETFQLEEEIEFA